MAVYASNEWKPGLKVMLEGDPCSILENEYVKPGKGQAFNRVKLRNLKTGAVSERKVDGVFVAPAERVTRALQEGQTLAIWPPIAGG